VHGFGEGWSLRGLCAAVLTGIYGMDFYVVLGRPGFRVARRKLKTGRVGASHKVTKQDAIEWFQKKFEGE
jgi:large subunit ribosomal protein L11e